MAKVSTVAYHIELTREEMYELVSQIRRDYKDSGILNDLYLQLEKALNLS